MKSCLVPSCIHKPQPRLIKVGLGFFHYSTGNTKPNGPVWQFGILLKSPRKNSQNLEAFQNLLGIDELHQKETLNDQKPFTDHLFHYHHLPVSQGVRIHDSEYH